jgi:peptidoglycan/LPS O-acetylase OafA/YrhL
MLAASAVIVSHSFQLSLGPDAAEPLHGILPFALGRAAVVVFFAVSGFFIMKSFLGRHSQTEFVVARALRLFPALLVVALVTTLVIGPAFTRLPLSDYLTAGETLRYVPRAISLFAIGLQLPGVFDRLPIPFVNGSLWTLFFEVSCYVGLVIAGLLTGYKPARFPIFLLAYAAAYALIVTRVVSRLSPDFATLSLPFVLGMAGYYYRAKAPLSWSALVGLIATAWLARSTGVLFYEATILVLAYGALCFGGLQHAPLLRYNRLGDYSYGMYIFGWPVQQILVARFPGIAPVPLMTGALLLTLPLAIASWTFVEEPALRWKGRLTAFLTRSVVARL